jgi:hypothetical protein
MGLGLRVRVGGAAVGVRSKVGREGGKRNMRAMVVGTISKITSRGRPRVRVVSGCMVLARVKGMLLLVVMLLLTWQTGLLLAGQT